MTLQEPKPRLPDVWDHLCLRAQLRVSHANIGPSDGEELSIR